MQDQARIHNYLFVIGEDKDLTFNVQSSNVADVLLGQTPFPGLTKDNFIPSNKLEYEPLIVQIVLSYDLREWVYLLKWMIKIKNNLGNHQDYLFPCELIALDSNNQPSTSFLYRNTWPFQLESIQYSIQGDNVVLTTSATLRYDEFVVKYNGETIDDDWDGELNG